MALKTRPPNSVARPSRVKSRLLGAGVMFAGLGAVVSAIVAAPLTAIWMMSTAMSGDPSLRDANRRDIDARIAPRLFKPNRLETNLLEPSHRAPEPARVADFTVAEKTRSVVSANVRVAAAHDEANGQSVLATLRPSAPVAASETEIVAALVPPASEPASAPPRAASASVNPPSKPATAPPSIKSVVSRPAAKSDPGAAPQRGFRLASAAPTVPPPEERNAVRKLFDSLLPGEASERDDTTGSVTAYANPDTPGRNDNRTAVYDIVGHTVYMPNGERLEAHSGLGSAFDDPGYAHVRMRGPTPPHTYRLTMREALFHGVAALRMTPVGDGNMHGRAGILAHTYMLGPRGESNGCVSFKDYDRFLSAFRRGEVTHMIVVDRLRGTPASVIASRGVVDNRYASDRKTSDR